MELEAKLEETPGKTSSPQKALENSQGAKAPMDDDNEEEELLPLKVAKSLSLPITRQPHQGIRLSPTETSI